MAIKPEDITQMNVDKADEYEKLIDEAVRAGNFFAYGKTYHVTLPIKESEFDYNAERVLEARYKLAGWKSFKIEQHTQQGPYDYEGSNYNVVVYLGAGVLRETTSVDKS